MKKIYYILFLGTFIFTACQKEPQLVTSTHSAPVTVQQLSITLQSSDYAKISSGYPKTSLSFDDLTDANTYIPQILDAEYVTAANGSSAAVTYTVSPIYFKLKDSVIADVSYTLTHDDYLLLTGNHYADFSPAQMLTWMNEDTSVYQNSVNDQLAYVTFTPYPSNLTPPPPYAYVKYSGTWWQCYNIQPAQYTAAGLKYGDFSSSNSEASLVTTFNFFLKNDITIMDTIRKNDLVFVSFKYYLSAIGADCLRVKPLQYDGNNFVVPFTTTATATFVKAGGAWKPQPIVTYTLTTADITIIENGAAGSAAAKANLTSYGDFSSAWATSDMNAAVIECLLVDFPSPQTGTIYKVTYPNYNSTAPDPLSFTWSGTAWVAQQQ